MPSRSAQPSNLIPQRNRSSPAICGTREYPSHGFQFFYFNEAPSALPKVLLAGQRICRVQCSVEKRIENELHSEQGPAVLVPDSEITTMHRLARQPASGLTMTFPFMFGWIEHK